MSGVIQLDSGRRSFSVQRGETIEPWWYDIVELKLCFEELQRLHVKKDAEKTTSLSADFIKALAVALSESYGLTGCTIDMAYQIYYIVSMQFSELHRSVREQAKSLSSLGNSTVNASV